MWEKIIMLSNVVSYIYSSSFSFQKISFLVFELGEWKKILQKRRYLIYVGIYKYRRYK